MTRRGGHPGRPVRRALRRWLGGGGAGAAALEFALASLVALPLLFGIIEVGRALHSRNALDHVADAAARSTLVELRHAHLGLAELEARLQAEARARWTATAPDRLTAHVSTQDDRLRLELRYRLDLLIPLVLLDELTLRAFRTVPALAF